MLGIDRMSVAIYSRGSGTAEHQLVAMPWAVEDAAQVQNRALVRREREEEWR